MRHELLRFSLQRLQAGALLARAAFRGAMMRSMSSISADVGILADVRGGDPTLPDWGSLGHGRSVLM